MIKPLDIFCEIPCLTEHSTLFRGSVLQKKWFKSADKRIVGQYLQKFIIYNSELLGFLNVQPFLVGADQNVSLAFKTNEFIGAIPLRSPDTGKQIGDLIVSPRFIGKDRFEDYINIINLLDSEVNPEIILSLPLASGRNFRPPLYLEAVKYIATLENLVKHSWRKFNSLEKVTDQPAGQVNWNKYYQNQYKVENHVRFPVRTNVLSEIHKEYSQLRYVFDICKAELLSANTPPKIKASLNKRLAFLDEKLYTHKPLKTKIVASKATDNTAVTKCKLQANKVLNNELVDSTAWRINFADVFEKFVQYIFKEVAKEIGGKVSTNFKIYSDKSNRYSWELNNLEPDAVYHRKDMMIFIDAKYKSNLYNKYANSESLKDDHRHDLHQILSYSSFSKSEMKNSFLCYPSNEVELKKTSFTNSISGTVNNIYILGIPLKKEIVLEVKKILIPTIDCL